ncbi:hypothetical protein JHK87_026199 [Glycine soja]|nr:hypothetical protein JHK87_026199 [Glycine soja]
MCFQYVIFGTNNLQVFNERKQVVGSVARIYFKCLLKDSKSQCQFFANSQVNFTKRAGNIIAD